MANLTDADKVLRNDTGKDIVTQLTAIKTAIENGGGGGGSGASTVSQLTDVLLSQNIPDGDVLVRDNNLTGGKLWKNATITVELTQAEYNQLVADDDVLPDVNYYITDAPSMQGTSADLSYDGTTLSTYDKIEGLNASNLPIESGIATNTKDYIDTITDIKSLVTFNENISGTNTNILVKCGVLYIYYQGETKSHNANDLLFTLPSGYRPSSLRYCTYNINDSAFGEVGIDTDGKCYINHISTLGANGRVYFAVAIPL